MFNWLRHFRREPVDGSRDNRATPPDAGNPATPVHPAAAPGARPAPLAEKTLVAALPGSVARTLPQCRIVFGLGQTGVGTPASYSPRPRHRDDARWVPPGGRVSIRGFDVAGGMVYTGNFLSAAPGGGWGADTVAPPLINPALPVASGRPDMSVDMGYWPSYSDIAPDRRLAYLSWLASGKRDTSAPVGYAFLYFYGLERRLLVDSPAPDEADALVAEVERLQSLFGFNASFAAYSQRLLEAVALVRASQGPDGLAEWRPDLITLGRSALIPTELLARLGAHIACDVPMDWEIALAAMLAMAPGQGGPPSNIGMSRTRKEFIELFRRRFVARYPNGFLPTGTRTTVLSLPYVAAARHLDVEFRVHGCPSLPNPLALSWRSLTAIATKAADDLVPYAKMVGKDCSKSDSVAAAMALPPDLADIGGGGSFRRWLGELPGPVAEVPFATLTEWCLGNGHARPGAKQIREVSAMLASAGFGMEPDPAHGGEKPDVTVLLFRTGSLSPAFPRAAAIAILLACADAATDPARVVQETASRLRLDTATAIRLAARCRAVRSRPLTPARIKALASAIDETGRPQTAALACIVACACGDVSHPTLTALEKFHEACGLDRRTLYGALHQGTATNAKRATEPVVVERRTAKPNSFRIPGPDKIAPATMPPAFAVDMDKVAAILLETREAEAVLAPIYREDDEPPAASMPPTAAPDIRFRGLGAGHAAILAELSARTEWTRVEFEAIVSGFGLMPDGALETINDWAFDAFDEPVIEDGDPLTINVALLRGSPETTE